MDALEYNYHVIKEKISNNSRICAVVKADAYGHGAVEVVKRLAHLGVENFAVATADEALEIRNECKNADILVFNTFGSEEILRLIDNNVSFSVYNQTILNELENLNKMARVHIKIDTGMGRVGFRWDDEETLQIISRISTLKNVRIEGVYTHFAEAGEFAKLQFSRFLHLIQLIQQLGIAIPQVHCCNSAVALSVPEFHMDMVRIGIALYGGIECELNLKPVMAVKARIIEIKTLEKGDSVSYERTYVASEKVKIAVVSMGYADGLSRILSNRGRFHANGKIFPILGKICMDLCMIDVTNEQNITVGDVVTFFGNDENTLKVSHVAQELDTISYEVFCMIGKRLPRLYN